jgi:RNA polymerase sigma-70 factor (ECF subfamily)
MDLLDAYARARAAHAAFIIPRETFVAHVSRVLDAASPKTPLESLHVVDLYLACGCAAGNEKAIATFEAECIARVPAFLRRLRLSSLAVDEVKQLLRARLLMRGSDGAPARILSYSGRGKLVSWVRVAAIRMALDLRGRTEKEEPVVIGVAATEGDAEIDLLSVRYRTEFENAVREAIASLPDRRRSLLRMHYVDGLNGEQIAAVYEVNRSTVSRWLAAAHSDLIARVRALLLERLDLTEQEIRSIGRHIVSQMALSAASLFENSSS